MTSEELSIAQEKIFEAGAVDVYFTPIFMKKNRPSYKISVMTKHENFEKVVYAIFNWTKTIGIRFVEMNRIEMDREKANIDFHNMSIGVKISSLEDLRKIKAEIEDLKKYIE